MVSFVAIQYNVNFNILLEDNLLPCVDSFDEVLQ